jgi:hypothetical protein
MGAQGTTQPQLQEGSVGKGGRRALVTFRASISFFEQV